MTGWTDCWLAEEGHGGGETLGPVLLALLLAAGQLDEVTQQRLAGFESESVQWRREHGGG